MSRQDCIVRVQAPPPDKRRGTYPLLLTPQIEGATVQFMASTSVVGAKIRRLVEARPDGKVYMFGVVTGPPGRRLVTELDMDVLPDQEEVGGW